jgi:uncharacterized protein (DUF697 family)/uncharacterized tellurite resistance protein B-like protein
MLSVAERSAIAAICLFAAFADGSQNEAEQTKLAGVLRELGDVDPSIFQRVVLRTTSIEAEASKLTTSETTQATRRLAFDLAVGMCDCDGATTLAERDVLYQLARALQLPSAAANDATTQAETVANVDLLEDAAKVTAGAAAAAATFTTTTQASDGPANGSASSTTNASAANETTRVHAANASSDADATVLKYAIANAALELLPQSLASMAIVPLQARMVYKIGTLYGYSLDSGHIKDFVATAGVGVTSQVFESYARKFLGKLTGRTLGRTAGAVAQKATGPAITFASTYALGQAAKVYYANGRKLTLDDLRALVAKQTAGAMDLYKQYEPQVAQTARTMSPTNVFSMLRGG